jgi:hypothetical protein
VPASTQGCHTPGAAPFDLDLAQRAGVPLRFHLFCQSAANRRLVASGPVRKSIGRSVTWCSSSSASNRIVSTSGWAARNSLPLLWPFRSKASSASFVLNAGHLRIDRHVCARESRAETHRFSHAQRGERCLLSAIIRQCWALTKGLRPQAEKRSPVAGRREKQRG